MLISILLCMPKIAFAGTGVIAMNGRQGKTITTRNAYGPYQRSSNFKAVNSGYANELMWQTLFGQVRQAWGQGISEDDRQAWIQAAGVVNARQQLKRFRGNCPRAERLTGFNFFVQRTMNILLVGGFPTGLPVPDENMSVLGEFKPLVFDPFSISMRLPIPNTANIFFNMYMSAPLSPGRMSTNQIYFNLWDPGFFPFAKNYFVSYSARAGAPPITGMKHFFKLDPINVITGQRVAPWICSGIVA